MMTKTDEYMVKFPARIHVLLASQAPVGLVIRRGPSKQVATILWNRETDEFKLGQWFKGRIYERRSDLSPDGKHFIYFAMNGNWDSEAKGAWTAISRTPYLQALTLFPKGDCWDGGGLWTPKEGSGTKKNSYWLNGRHEFHSTLFDTNEVYRDKRFAPSWEYGAECHGVYYPRLLRDGWYFVERINAKRSKRKDIFEKPLGYGWTLRKIAQTEIDSPVGKGCYWDEHQLIASNRQTNCPDWEWAELDGKRLVWAKEGKLFAGNIRLSGLTDEIELFDFNPMTFEPIEAPY